LRRLCAIDFGRRLSPQGFRNHSAPGRRRRRDRPDLLAGGRAEAPFSRRSRIAVRRARPAYLDRLATAAWRGGILVAPVRGFVSTTHSGDDRAHRGPRGYGRAGFSRHGFGHAGLFPFGAPGWSGGPGPSPPPGAPGLVLFGNKKPPSFSGNAKTAPFSPPKQPPTAS